MGRSDTLPTVEIACLGSSKLGFESNTYTSPLCLRLFDFSRTLKYHLLQAKLNLNLDIAKARQFVTEKERKMWEKLKIALKQAQADFQRIT